MRFFSINRNLLSKSLSSNLWYKPRIFSPSIFDSRKTLQVRTPGVVGDLKPNNKPMLLIEHSHRERTTTHYLLSTELNSWKLDSLDCPASGQDYFGVSASCNGLVLLNFLRDQAVSSEDEVAALWKPKTNNIVTLKSNIRPLFCSKDDLGFDPASQDYKVIKFLFFHDQYDPAVELYSLKTESWKEITFPYSCSPEHGSVNINGLVYWKTTTDQPADGFILSFDFANEKFSHIPLPEPTLDVDCVDAKEKLWLFDDFILAEFYGLLAAVVHSELRTKTKPFDFEIWVWNDESWSKSVSTITIYMSLMVFPRYSYSSTMTH